MVLHLQIPKTKTINGEQIETVTHACSTSLKNSSYASGGVLKDEFEKLPEHWKCKRCAKKLAQSNPIKTGATND